MDFIQIIMIGLVIYGFLNNKAKELVDKKDQAPTQKTSKTKRPSGDPADQANGNHPSYPSKYSNHQTSKRNTYQSQKSRRNQPGLQQMDNEALEAELRAKLPRHLINHKQEVSQSETSRTDQAQRPDRSWKEFDQEIQAESWSPSTAPLTNDERGIIRSDSPASMSDSKIKGLGLGDQSSQPAITRATANKKRKKATLKKALVWSEILQPPKSLR